MKRLFVLWLLALTLPLPAQDTNSATSVQDGEIARLKMENEQLKDELNKVKDSGPPPTNATVGENNDSVGTRPSSGQPWNLGLILLIAIPPLVIVGTVLAWFLVIAPRRRRRSLVEALEILSRHDPETFQEIERLLVRALTSGLGPEDVADARFALAYIRARTGHYGEANAILADIESAADLTSETAYLKFWILARQRKHEEVETFYDRQAKLIGDFLDARRIASITFLHLGRKFLALRATQTALDYFDRVRALEVLADQVPSDLADHHLIFGLSSVFEKNWEDARKHFKTAAESVTHDTLVARLGLLLCDWRENPRLEIEESLTELLPAIEAAHAEATALKASTASKDRKDDPRDEKRGKDEEPDESTLLLAGCRLWHVFSFLRNLKLRPDRTTFRQEDMDVLMIRTTAVKEIDTEMAEPWLIEGLIAYYFAAGDSEARATALGIIEEAVKREMSVPEVILLLENEHQQQQVLREGYKTYLKLIRSYLANQEVPDNVRRDVREQLVRFERFKDLSDLEITTGERDAAPSVAELQSRVEIIHQRIVKLVRPRLNRSGDQLASAELDLLSKDIKETTKVLQEKAAHLETTEGKLAVYAGPILLSEEAPILKTED